MTDSSTPTVLLVRHGQTPLNAQARLRGRLDPDLDETGREQVELLAAALEPYGARQVLSSPRRRAVDTAAPIARVLGVHVEVVPDLDDRDYGPWAGQERTAVEQRWGSVDAAPGVEPAEAVGARIGGVLDALAEPFPVVLVSHDAVLGSLLATLDPSLGPASALHLDTASWSVVEREGDGWQVRQLDRTVSPGQP